MGKSKFKALNPKQCQNPNDQNPKLKEKVIGDEVISEGKE